MTPIVITAFAVRLLFASPRTVAAEARVTLTCKPDALSFAGDATINCRLVNGLHEPVMVPVESIVAEGPTDRHYIYRFIAGERYEHVFQYERASKGSLDRPILFEPTIHLSSEAIHGLRWLGPGLEAAVRVRWQPPPSTRKMTENWKARLKIIYVPLSKLRQVSSQIRRGDCIGPDVLQRRVDLVDLSLTVHYRQETDPWARDDGCHDVVSLAFENVISPSFGIRLVPSTGSIVKQ